MQGLNSVLFLFKFIWSLIKSFRDLIVSILALWGYYSDGEDFLTFISENNLFVVVVDFVSTYPLGCIIAIGVVYVARWFFVTDHLKVLKDEANKKRKKRRKGHK